VLVSRNGRRRHLAAAVLAAAVALSPVVAAVLPAGWAAGPTSATAADDTTVTVLIDRVTPAVLRPGQDLTVDATLRNDGPTPLDGVTAALRLNRVRPATRTELEAWVTGSGGAVGSRVDTSDPVTIPPGGTVAVTLTVPAAAVGLLDQSGVWGPRGLAVEAIGGGARLGIQRTFALWQPDESVPQVRVSLLAPVTAATDDDTLAAATGKGGRLRSLVDLAAADRDVELAVDPAVVAAAQDDGADTRTWAADLLSALSLRDAFALPWADPDLAAIAHADRPGLLTTAIGLSSRTTLDGTNARTDVLWAPDGDLDRQTVEVAAAAGATALVVGSDMLQVTDGVGTARVDLDAASGSLAALVPDGLLTQLFIDPGSVEPGATTATTVQRLLAEIAVLAHDGAAEPHHVLIAPGRDWSPDVPLASALLSALRSSPWSRLVPVSALLGAADDGTDRGTLPTTAVARDEMPAVQVQALADARDTTARFAEAIGDSGTLTDGLDVAVLAPLSVAWRADPDGRAALERAAVDKTTSDRTGLALAPAANLNLVSASAPVRFVVRNDLAVPATVAVQVTPRKACLRPARSDLVTAAPGEETAVVVNLVAAANCDVTVDATLVGGDGVDVGGAVRFDARVAPTIEDVGTVVVGVLLAIGLLLGIVRTVRRGQSARRGARRTAEEDAPPLPVLGGEVPPHRTEDDEG
jgi:hypothetical protein